MKTRVTEIARDTYRLSAFHPELGLQFNHYLIDDDEPFLMHTGMRALFPGLRQAVAEVLPPARLRWIGISHFEADECGALNDWLAIAPAARPLCGLVGAMINLTDFADRPPQALEDGATLETGSHSLRYLATPHLPHGWDAGLFFDASERTLFCSDLFVHTGDPPPLVETDVVGPAREAIRASLAGPLAGDVPFTGQTEAILARLADLGPRTLALMHGSTFRGDGSRALTALAKVLREHAPPPRERAEPMAPVP